ncbi:MAG: hypothetical protein GY854_29545 [Deltaproteobacteria bacterium]|nr:hypothetical protein [Deltaproteobacteria bacterium]
MLFLNVEQRVRIGVAIAVLLGCLTISHSAMAQRSDSWVLTGGPPWEARVGPGIMLAVGGNDCTNDLCDDVLDTSFFGSIGGTAGFFYRIIPNLVVLLDVHLGHVNTDMISDTGPDEHDLEDDRGFLFQAVTGAEFHGPITGWLDTYIGLGIGFAYLKASGKYNNDDADGDLLLSFRGLDFELRTGVDVYPFSAIPTLGMGVLFRLGMVYWPKACIEHNSDTFMDQDECRNPDNADWLDDEDLPFLVHLGFAFRYGF